MTSPSTAPPRKRELTLQLIVVEKAVKALLVLVAAVIFTVMLVTGTSVHLHGLATHLREHVSAAWTIYAADALVSATERRKLTVITSALFLDAASTSLEWYALAHGKRWGEWLVVATMSALVPFEVASLLRWRRLGRLFVLLGNLAIVGYLAHHAWKRQKEPAPA